MAYTPREPQVLAVLTHGNPVLKKIAKEVVNVRDELIQSLINDMVLTSASAKKCVGLSAPQIGVSLRVIIVAPPGKDPRVLVNPRIIQWSSIRKSATEGCLSIPGVEREVNRSIRVTVSFQDRDGTLKTEKFKDFEARIVQHEIDHLNGVLITDK